MMDNEKIFDEIVEKIQELDFVDAVLGRQVFEIEVLGQFTTAQSRVLDEILDSLSFSRWTWGVRVSAQNRSWPVEEYLQDMEKQDVPGWIWLRERVIGEDVDPVEE